MLNKGHLLCCFHLLCFLVTSTYAAVAEKRVESDAYYNVYGILGDHYDLDNGRPFIHCTLFFELLKTRGSNETEGAICNGEMCLSKGQCFVQDGRLQQRLGCMGVFRISSNYTLETLPRKTKLTSQHISPEMQGCWQHQGYTPGECTETEEVGSVIIYRNPYTVTISLKCAVDASNLQQVAEFIFCCCKRHLCNTNVVVYDNLDFLLSSPADSTGQEVFAHNGVRLWLLCILTASLFVIIVLGSVRACRTYPFCQEHRKILEEDIAGSVSELEKTLLESVPSLPNPIRIVQEVARGRFGTVYSGVLLEGGRASEAVLAVKVFLPCEYDSFKYEVEAYQMNGMRENPFILFFHGSLHLKNDSRFILTQYHEHGSLEKFLEHNILTAEIALKFVFTILKGLLFLHDDSEASGGKPPIVHRDMKSRNVLVKSDLTCAIGDFGLSICCFSGCVNQHKKQVGTHRYMAPEMLEGSAVVSIESFRKGDIYATALVIWEIMNRVEVPGQETPPACLPYEKEVSGELEKEAMRALLRDVVGKKGLRPEWRRGLEEQETLAVVISVAEDMWWKEAEARIPALCGHNRLLRHLHVPLPDPVFPVPSLPSFPPDDEPLFDSPLGFPSNLPRCVFHSK